MTKLWGGRFSGGLDPSVLALSRSTHFDVRLIDQDCRVLAAWAGALQRAGVLTQKEAAALRKALKALPGKVASGAFPVEPGDEDVHTTVERALTSAVPDAAAKVRAGLSRNDRVATAFRLWTIEHGAVVSDLIADLIEVFVEAAKLHARTIMPGYTHLQHAQPVTLGMVVGAHAEALRRDCGRLDAALARASSMPLGAGALAGTTLPIDREPLAEELGFNYVAWNTIDAVSSRDFALEVLAALAICGVHLSRIGEEIVLWTSAEFGFAILDDAFATGSSLMPQKKNPDVAELARGKSGRLVGNLTGLLTALKGLPLAYNRDLQEDKEAVFDAMDTMTVLLPALTGTIATMRFDAGRMRRAAEDPVLLATDLAEHLVTLGVPFSDAHEVVGKAVRIAIDEGRSLRTFTEDEWRALHPKLAAANKILDLNRSIKMRGGAKPVKELERWLKARKAARKT